MIHRPLACHVGDPQLATEHDAPRVPIQERQIWRKDQTKSQNTAGNANDNIVSQQ